MVAAVHLALQVQVEPVEVAVLVEAMEQVAVAVVTEQAEVVEEPVPVVVAV